MTERWFVLLCHAARLTWNRSKKSSSAAMGRVWRPSLGSVYTLLLVTMVYRPWLESLHSVVGYYGLHAFIRVSTLCCWLLQFTGLHYGQYTVLSSVYKPPLGSVHCCWLLQFTCLHCGQYTVIGYWLVHSVASYCSLQCPEMMEFGKVSKLYRSWDEYRFFLTGIVHFTLSCQFGWPWPNFMILWGIRKVMLEQEVVFFLNISSYPVKLLTVHLHVTYTWTGSCLKCWSELYCVFKRGKWHHETVVVYLREINDLLKASDLGKRLTENYSDSMSVGWEVESKLFWFYECCMGGVKQIILILQVLQCRWKGKTAGYTLIS